jgi:hypothetical protein
MQSKSIFTYIGEAIDKYRTERQQIANGNVANTNSTKRLPTILNWFLPNGGTILIVLLLLLTQQVWANNTQMNSSNTPGPSATTINYQGRLAAPDGTPQNGTFGMSFSIWDAAAGGDIIWGPENHVAVPVTDGLFNVGLGSQTSGGIPTTAWNSDRYLEITVAGETLAPRELIRSVPIAGMALTVPDGSITSNKLSPNAAGKWTMLTQNQNIISVSNSNGFDYQTIDISSMVPSETDIIYVSVYLTVQNGTGFCRVRPYGSTNPGSAHVVASTSNTLHVQAGMVAANDSKIEYMCEVSSGATISGAGIVLWGYYEPGH